MKGRCAAGGAAERHALCLLHAPGLPQGRQQLQHVRGKARKVHQQRLAALERAVLLLPHGERVEEKRVRVIRNLKVKHAVAAARGAAMGLGSAKVCVGGGAEVGACAR